MQKSWRIKELLEWTTRYFLNKGIQASRLEAEILLAHGLEKSRVYLYANYDEPVNQTEREKFRDLIKRRTAGEPLAYIVGRKEFMSLDFKVTPDVLIPRPDTEILVETAINIAGKGQITRICDVGTGSGAIAISLAVYMPASKIYATDLSGAALNIARENALRHNAAVDFREGDLLAPLENEEWMDMITANLPYVTLTEVEKLESGVKDWEPRLALAATGDGLDIYRRLAPQARQLLRPGGYMLWEIDPRQARLVRDILSDFDEIEIFKDGAGKDRLVKARRSIDV
ncbi:MAG: peptide chain release factor N(5)-glutamine methyltransferase [Syntrophomonadaceae bacterium]|nr:peptide chain release factor N(5)-glutamine methyltransferase [Syntrophomonadaceae bacterium]